MPLACAPVLYPWPVPLACAPSVIAQGVFLACCEIMLHAVTHIWWLLQDAAQASMGASKRHTGTGAEATVEKCSAADTLSC